jgi:hypothetical protein
MVELQQFAATDMEILRKTEDEDESTVQPGSLGCCPLSQFGDCARITGNPSVIR